jgi:hypothetical protein
MGKVQNALILFVHTYTGVSPLSPGGGTKKGNLSKLINQRIKKHVFISEFTIDLRKNMTGS